MSLDVLNTLIFSFFFDLLGFRLFENRFEYFFGIFIEVSEVSFLIDKFCFKNY